MVLYFQIYYVEFIYWIISSFIVDERAPTLTIYACDLILCHPVKEHSLLIQFKHVAVREYSLNGWRYTYCPGVSRYLAKLGEQNEIMPLSRNRWIIISPFKQATSYTKYEHGLIRYKYRKPNRSMHNTMIPVFCSFANVKIRSRSMLLVLS